MEYIDQSPDALALSIVKGRINREDLNVIKDVKLDAAFGRIEAGIIGASHFCQFSLNDGTDLFAEMFACIKPASSKATTVPLSEYRGIMHMSFKSIDYSMEIAQYNWESGQKHHAVLLQKVKAADNTNSFGLSFTFPSKINGNFEPVTLLFISKINDTDVSVETLHAYPDHDVLVFTRSTVQMNREIH